tara:strand:+ start:210 stop:356 length:147 start_codon:yes stop_codon:yes gene_type:complete
MRQSPLERLRQAKFSRRQGQMNQDETEQELSVSGMLALSEINKIGNAC